MNTTRTVFRIHSWMGLITGAFLLVISLTGVYLVYDAEIDRALNPDFRILALPTHPVSLDNLVRPVRAAYGDRHVGLVTFPVDPQAPYVASLRFMTGDGTFVRDQVYMDGETGKIAGHRVSNHYLTSWILRLHEGLWIPDRWGQPLVAILGIVMALMGLTGLWVYRRRIWDALRFRKSAERIGRLHSHLGVWALLFAILLGVTGTILNFSSLLIVCRAPAVPEMGSEWSILDRIPPLDTLLAEAHRAFPDLELHGVYFPSKPNEPVKVGGYVPGAHILGKSSYVAFAVSRSPRVVGIFDARGASLGMRLLLMTNALHYGDFGGNASKIPYVAGGLVLTFLAGSGLWIRLRPRRS